VRVHIARVDWDLDVDSTSPPGEKSRKGSAVRRL